MAALIIDRPVVLTINSTDCSGATGLTADICTIAALGAHPAPVASAVLARDTQSVKDRSPISRLMVIEQLRAVLEDSPVAAIKLGDTGDIANTEAIHTVLEEYPRLPLIFDPCWQPEDQPTLSEALRVLVLPRVDVLVITTEQAQGISSAADNFTACASELLDTGCKYVLVTGVDNDGGRQRHQLFTSGRAPRDFDWTCRPHRIQGIGSTLSAAIASYAAFGAPMDQCCDQALSYTCQTMADAYRAGMGRLIPNRLAGQGPSLA